ncbi:Na+/H+ antiporter NhaC [Macrococcus equipercicus]|uniref:Na+/H+ antiporter NhaC n=1 Tax=Macrococcus equipercicus TaxID=69967 RepID=A0ABQ6R860_9STAP|nr:Na+/H+ antiporter NhaC [Macrococcus equipercicus]KAA1039302.1 Na+/H+ antiporter NhaC [Macrococcus equipercicus]
MISDSKRGKRQINVWFALVPLVFMIVSMIITVVFLQQAPHIPLMIGTALAAIVAYFHGYTWEEIEEMMYKGIKLALPAIVIIILVGLVIGAWIGGGVVATMIYYGLKLITPSMFLVTICLICGIVSLAIGSSWSTMATVGVAGMGIGLSMDIPAGMIAGAVISGSYFGDKMSPLSDTTNLAAGLTGTNLFDHIKHMFYTTIPGLLIALAAYFIIGRQFNASHLNTSKIDSISDEMSQQFVITPWLLLVPVIVIVLVALKVPAVPALVVGILLGSGAQLFVQGDSLNVAASTLQEGYVLKSDNALISELFNKGGLESMFFTISMTIVAMTFGGILEYSGMLTAIIEQILKVAKGTAGLIAATVTSCFVTNATCSEQYISIVVPSRMYIKAYIDQNLHPKNLSRALEDGGTLTSVFIPWNTCGVFIFTTLNVGVMEYAPFAILNYVIPVISILYGITGFKIVKMSREEREYFTEKSLAA